MMHTGRVAHSANLSAGARVLAPSAIALSGTMCTDTQGPQPHPVPQAMTEAEIEQAIGEHVSASNLAIEAGFNGMELHGAHGYLIEQFLKTACNHRTDAWNGNVSTRIRFAVEIAKRVGKTIEFDRVGIRVSPYDAFNNMKTDPKTENVSR